MNKWTLEEHNNYALRTNYTMEVKRNPAYAAYSYRTFDYKRSL